MDTYALTSGIRSGDEAAFDAFYQRFAERMYHYLLVVARGDEDHAREVHQESMLRVIRYIKPLGTDEELWRYLTSIMRSVIVDLSRRTRAATARENEVFEAALAQRTPGSEDSARERMLTLLNQALAKLSEEDRRLLEEHYFSHVPQVEIATAREMSVKAVGMKMHRLRSELRQQIMKGLKDV